MRDTGGPSRRPPRKVRRLANLAAWLVALLLLSLGILEVVPRQTSGFLVALPFIVIIHFNHAWARGRTTREIVDSLAVRFQPRR